VIVRGTEVQEEEPGFQSPLAYRRGRDWQGSESGAAGTTYPPQRRGRRREAEAITTSIWWLGAGLDEEDQHMRTAVSAVNIKSRRYCQAPPKGQVASQLIS